MGIDVMDVGAATNDDYVLRLQVELLGVTGP
jgi:hypothetical protein